MCFNHELYNYDGEHVIRDQEGSELLKELGILPTL